MTRLKMPNRRDCITQRIVIDGKKIYLSVGFKDDLNLEVGEIFLTVQKTGAQERALYDEIARGASKRLQLGESLESVAEGWLGTKLKPCGIVSGDKGIRFCQGPLDWAGRHLLINFCGRTDLSTIKEA